MRGTLERLARRADLITASTDALRERLETYNSNVVTVLNALDAELWFSPRASRDDRSPGERAGSFRLLYFGTRTHQNHQNDLPLVEEFVRDPGNSTTLTVVGGVQPGSLEWCELVDPPRSDREYPFFVRWLKAYAADFDAVIAPLADTEFNEAKSDLKFLEGTALGLPVICSDVRAFESLKGRNVALMPGPSPAEWSDAITSLRDEPDLGDALARAGEAYVKAERLIGQETTAYSSLLADVTANATRG
jgi:glycosyltransferase involved in cell wall biosynthesis